MQVMNDDMLHPNIATDMLKMLCTLNLMQFPPHVLVACTDEWTPTQAYHSTGLNQCTVIHKFRPYFPGKYVEPGFNATVHDTLLQESYPYHYTKLPLTQNEFFFEIC